MADQSEKARTFSELHLKGQPLVLFNAWDSGSAKAIHEAGAAAIATSSWAVADAQGYSDGEQIPLALVCQLVERIVATVDAPVTVDFEGGYSEDDTALAENITQLIELGVIGINFEDRVVKGSGLYPVDRQARRIEVIRRAAKLKGIDLFVNARTDLFLRQPKPAAKSIDEAIERAIAYAAAGASGFFVPGLVDEKLIQRVCEVTKLPINCMVMKGLPSTERLAELGVSRISYGGGAYTQTMANLQTEARRALSPSYSL